MPQSVALARRFVRSLLDGVGPAVADTAALLTGELATNAVLHARTEFEVRAWVGEGRVHVRVSDQRPERGLVPHDHRPYACTGRGLTLVEELAPSHGVHSTADRKTVWFELWPEPPAPPTSAWETVPPSGRNVNVTLTDVPYALYWAAQQHWEGLLRELYLTRELEARTGVRREDLAVAQDVSNVICSCMKVAVQQETPDSSTLSLLVAFPAGAAAAVAVLRGVIDEAEVAGRQGALLSLPALPQIRAFPHWLFDQVGRQLAGADPTAWTLTSGEPNGTPTELAPWDAGEVETASAPTVAADDLNRIIAVNTAAAELLGWSPTELVGRPLTVLMPEHLRERHVAAFSSLLLTGEARTLGLSIPLPAQHRDGRLVPVRLQVQTQEAVDGRTVFVAQLTSRSAPFGRSPAREEGRYTSPQPGPVSLPSTTTKAKRASVSRSALERLSLMADIGSAMTSTPVLGERLRRVCGVLTQRLAEWCTVVLVDEQGHTERACFAHRDPQLQVSGVSIGRLPAVSETAQGSLPRVLRGAGPLLVTDIPEPGRAESPLDAQQLQLFEQLDADSAIVAPLRARREVLGALTLVRTRQEHPFTKDDVLLVAELARNIAFGVDNARMFQQTRHTAERLQRALLPELPEAGHLRMAARYVPSSTTAEVGGDWYDAFVLPPGDTVLVIGDVAGHDLKAAVTMSALRNMLRGIAVDRPEPPGDVLRHLDHASQTLYPHSTATCVYALIKGDEGGPWDLHHSSAGHLPPLLTTAEGETRYLDGGAGLLIGMDVDLPRPTAQDRLPPHSTLLLYTDGLVERRGEPLDAAMARLRRHTAALARQPVDVFCDELIITLGADSTDDIALLALRPTPTG
ncbi:regulatory protein [Kitasatospora cheerisanensis KCTC 2395]|uniref:protein-serine/threonine phosphatase n=1 Tax=Kitasatospora cheerisanensis KCTC 2395 TaxID=1348663 RepID=A0A066Z164_9ACTN|nr:regulatory protein [Kitasatospora cheerisanensis KCTC 2395]